MSRDELEAAVLNLPETDRARLAHILIESLDEVEAAGELDSDWIAEVDRRAEQILNGEVELIPGEEVFRDALRRISDP